MKGLIRQINQLIDAREVVILFLGACPQACIIVLGVRVRQDPRAARVQPVSRVGLRVPLHQAGGNGVGGVEMVGGVGCVCGGLVCMDKVEGARQGGSGWELHTENDVSACGFGL